MTFKKAKNGFTLVELIVVITIIGILSTIMVVGITQAKARSRDAKRIADLSSIQTAIELYYEKNDKYPTPTQCQNPPLPAPATGYNCSSGNSSHWLISSPGSLADELKDYLASLPKDPVNVENSNLCGGSTEPIRKHYIYQTDLTGSQYKIIATDMESPSGKQKADNDNDGSSVAARDCEYELFSPGARGW